MIVKQRPEKMQREPGMRKEGKNVENCRRRESELGKRN